MKTLSQKEFAAPADLAAVEEEPLVIHKSQGSLNRHLILFVHGLGGQRYGEKATWGKFPQFVFEDIPEADVGLYGYRTLLGRLRFWRSVQLRSEAQVFADILRDELSDYRSIVLVGHSMGGLLCKAAISRLVANNERHVLSRISGLMLMATPQLGSMRVPSLMARLSPDFYALKPHGEFISEITATFEDHIHCEEAEEYFERVTIPAWAVLGASDFWVDQVSSGIGLASKRKKIARGSHTEIVKPKDKENPVYGWVRDRFKQSLQRFRYDVFIASAMASIQSQQAYEQSRQEILALEQHLKEHCNFKNVFYAGNQLSTMAEFEAEDVALVDDMRALRESRYFLLVYPQKVVSSVLFEAGLAAAMGKPSVYFVQNRDDLPYLMQRVEQAALPGKVKIYEYSSQSEILNWIAKHGARLWQEETLPLRANA